MSGYLTIYRSIFDTPEWREERVFSAFEAWFDLIAMASYVERVVTLDDGREVELRRGEVLASQRQLAKRWGWSASKVNRHLKKWADSMDKRIEVYTRRVVVIMLNETPSKTPSSSPSETQVSIIKLCNFDKYNGIAMGAKTPSETPSETPCETTINKYIEIRDYNTHTQFIELVKFFAGACAPRTHEEKMQLAEASRALMELREAEAEQWKGLDEVTRNLIILWAGYTDLQMVFKEPLNRHGLTTIMRDYEWEDVQSVVNQMANKLCLGDTKLYSFFLTFRDWASRCNKILLKAKLGNPKYAKMLS